MDIETDTLSLLKRVSKLTDYSLNYSVSSDSVEYRFTENGTLFKYKFYDSLGYWRQILPGVD